MLANVLGGVKAALDAFLAVSPANVSRFGPAEARHSHRHFRQKHKLVE